MYGPIIALAFVLFGCAQTSESVDLGSSHYEKSHSLPSGNMLWQSLHLDASVPLATWSAKIVTEAPPDASIFSDMIAVAFDILFLFSDASAPNVDASAVDATVCISPRFCDPLQDNDGDEGPCTCGETCYGCASGGYVWFACSIGGRNPCPP